MDFMKKEISNNNFNYYLQIIFIIYKLLFTNYYLQIIIYK